MTNSVPPSNVPVREAILNDVIQIICRHLDAGPEEVRPDSRLVEDLGFESLDIVELFVALEERFGVHFPDDFPPQAFTNRNACPLTLAEWVQLCWASGESRSRPPAVLFQPDATVERMPFTQLGGSCPTEEWQEGPLYDPLGCNREGFQQLRRRTDGMRCVLIPECECWMGNPHPDALPDQTPLHQVTLSAFLLDAEPVSNLAFARFLNSAGPLSSDTLREWCGSHPDDRRAGQFGLDQSVSRWEPKPGTDEQPVILVSWYGANAYSLWANRLDWRWYRADGQLAPELAGRSVLARSPSTDSLYSLLPSEAQWEYAARGPCAREEAGQTLRESRPVTDIHASGARHAATELPSAAVSLRLGMSPFGVHHMGGNVWQWCRDWYDAGFYGQPEASYADAQNGLDTGVKVERGGSWVGPAQLAEPWYRRGRAPIARGQCLGFRCVGIASKI